MSEEAAANTLIDQVALAINAVDKASSDGLDWTDAGHAVAVFSAVGVAAPVAVDALSYLQSATAEQRQACLDRLKAGVNLLDDQAEELGEKGLQAVLCVVEFALALKNRKA